MDDTFYNYYDSNGYGYQFYVSPEFTVSEKTLDSIEVTTPPTRTTYREGEDFSSAGMVVTAAYADSTTAPVVLYTVTDGSALTAGKTTVTVRYTEGGVTKTTTQTITVAKEYTVTVEGGTGGGKYIAGETVTVSAFAAGGQKFKEWLGADSLTFTGCTGKTSAIATFTMPAQDVTVKAVTEEDDTKYPVSVEHGSGDGNYAMGDIVTITADAPPSGMYFAGWEVSDGLTLRYAEDTDSRSSTAKFYMPPNAVSISAVYNLLTLVRIDIVASPTKTAYTVGENFDPAGMEVIATYSNRSAAPVTGYTVSSAGALSESDTQITVTYTEDGVITTAVQAIRVTAAVYTVSFDANGGTGTMAPATGISGEYTLPVCGFTAPAGKQFKAWSVGGSEKAVGDKITITADTAVTAVWEESSVFDEAWYWALVMLYSRKFDIAASASQGGVIDPAGVTKVSYSKSITYTITPAAGCAIQSVFVDGKDIGAVSTYTFRNVTGKHTIHAVFEAVNPYTDVKPDDWFCEDVLYVTNTSLMNGTGDGKFSPDLTSDRAMLVTVLWRLEGCPVVDSPVDFSDAADGLWYSEAIEWASANGIVNGHGDGTFAPTDPITREQIAAILHRYAAYKGWTNGTAFPMLAPNKYSEWAENDVIRAENSGLLDGLSVNIFDMTAEASRAELAAYLSRFMKNIVP